jgi:hypothetical protein
MHATFFVHPILLYWIIYSKKLPKSEAPCNILEQNYFLWRGVVSLTSNSQAGGPPLPRCSRLLIQYIRSYPPYLEAISSIHNLRTCSAMLTKDPFSIGTDKQQILYKFWSYHSGDQVIIPSSGLEYVGWETGYVI